MILKGLISAYVALFVIAPMVSAKIVGIGPWTFTAGMIVITLSYGLLDVVNDLWGKAEARLTVGIAAVVRVGVFAILLVIVALPTQRSPEGFDSFIGQSFRLLIAGELAMLASQWVIDVPVFDWVKRTFDTWFSVRYLGSTAISVAIGSAVFLIVGFFGTGADVFSLWWGSILVRMLMVAVLALPLAWLRKGVIAYGADK